MNCRIFYWPMGADCVLLLMMNNMLVVCGYVNICAFDILT